LHLIDGTIVTVQRDENAKLLAQKTIFSARRLLPSFRDTSSPEAVQRFAYLMQNTLGNPSFISSRSLDGPVQVWVIALKNSNGILTFELWNYAEVPRFYIFSDRYSPIIVRLLKKMERYLYSPFFVVRP
jgi:hypothetical protein